MTALRIGMRVAVRGGFGREAPEVVTVTGIGEEMGRAVIDYTDGKGRNRWAYREQVMFRDATANDVLTQREAA